MDFVGGKVSDMLSLLTGNATELLGNANATVAIPYPVDEMPKNGRGVLTWVRASRLDALDSLPAGCVVIAPPEAAGYSRGGGITLVICKLPRRAFMTVLSKWFDRPDPKWWSNMSLDPVYWAEDSLVGIGTTMAVNTVVANHVRIGNNCTIGGRGFGYEIGEDGSMFWVPHLGNVVIEEGVEIGNNTCIDRAVLGSTRIGKNVKIDNLVHIAHNVQVGKDSVIIAQAMIGGSVTIGEGCWIAPSACIRNGVTIGDGAIVGLAANVVKDVEPGATVVGNPAKPINTGLRHGHR